MLYTIEAGITPEQFISKVNYNFAGAIVNTPDLISALTTSGQFAAAANSNFDISFFFTGMKASKAVELLNQYFGQFTIDQSPPTDLTVVWTNDYAKIDFTDNTGGLVGHEIWECIDGENYSLIHTLDPGVVTYNNYTWQNATLRTKIRAVGSEFSDVVSIPTPLVFKTNQSTLRTVTFQIIGVTLGKTLTIDWGDGTTTNVTQAQTTNLTKNYSTQQNPYFIQLKGDTDWITYLDFYQSSVHSSGDISKWITPSKMIRMHLFQTGFTGSINALTIAPNQVYYHVGWNTVITGDITNWVFPATLSDFHIEGNDVSGDLTNWTFRNPQPNAGNTGHLILDGNNLTGNLSGWILTEGFTNVRLPGNLFVIDLSQWTIPTTLSQLCFSFYASNQPTYVETNQLSGDISEWVLPTTVNANSFTWMIANQPNVSGNLSNWIIPDGAGLSGQTVLYTEMCFRGCAFTGLPRGYFKNVSVYDFYNNYCSSGEIDNFLVYLDNHFEDGLVPLTNCVYTLNGANMGTPSATGLAAIDSIMGKYISAGKTITISVNS